MREQPVQVRIKNFEEVPLGYSPDEATTEARRCRGCKKPPCVKGCPVEINIPKFISFIAERAYREAIKEVKRANNLPAICGRVCPQETQCEKDCILGKKGEPVAIGFLERFVADWEYKEGIKLPQKGLSQNSKDKVAVVGSGPAGLSCAGDLAKQGYKVVIFESLHLPGGVLMYGIPEFRLPKKVVASEVEYVKNLGVEIWLNMVIGKVLTIKELFEEGFKAIFIATGAGLPSFMGIEGENLCGVYSANEFLTRVNLMRAYLFPEWETPIKIGDRVGVIGGGNVAIDAARVAKRLGAKEVLVIYRRSENEMPAREEEIKRAKEEGISFLILTNPTKFISDGNGWLRGVELIKNSLGEPDESGRRRPVPISGSEFFLELETAVVAIGQQPNPLIPRATPELKIGKKGNIEVDTECQTSLPGVFAGGDIATGAATVISAMGMGRKAAKSINTYIQKFNSISGGN
jgi:glutamate synthase (NADPH/NADH) small chain